jgi:serine/threonine protein kinase
MSFIPGTKLGHYEVIALIGAGGMGEVYRARDPRLGRDVAIKTLPANFAADPHALQRFEREARIVSALSHPNICPLFDLGIQDGNQFIVMECLEGRTLKEAIGEQSLPLSSIVDWGIQIASALQAAHASGIIHRDVKPANIFITRQGVAKLLDFGLAKIEKTRAGADSLDDQTLTATELTLRGVPVGTIAYMSPEQAQGMPASPQSDLFSLGAVLYEMATARRAFPGISTAEIFAAILHSAPIPPSRLNPAIPREFDGALERLLDKSPEARYSTAAELLAALRNLSRPDPSASRTFLSSSNQQVVTQPEKLQSLAILPLVNLSTDVNQDYFVDGLTEALITAVARLGGLRIISRTSAMCYKKATKPVPVIAQELNVDAVLEGSVLRSGDRLRINCRLIDPRTEQHLWSESFDHHLRDILSLHDDFTQAIAASLRTRVLQRSQESAQSPRKVNPESYDSYLRGRYFWNKRNDANLKKAIECFRHALDLDPLYAPAYSGIADSYFYLGYSFGRLDPNDAMPKAKAAAFRALELDPSFADAHCSLGLVQLFYDWDWPASEVSFKRALALNPGCISAHHFYSLLLSANHRTKESLEHIYAAFHSDPLSLPINNFVGMMHFAARQYDPAITAQRRTVEMDPEFGLGHAVLGAALEAKGLADEAAEEYITSLIVGRHTRDDCDAIRSAYQSGGISGLHQEDLRQSIRRWNGWHGLAVDIGALHAGIGHVSESLHWLEGACDSRSGRLVWLNSGTPFSRIPQYFDNLRNEPRFLRLLDRVHLPI